MKATKTKVHRPEESPLDRRTAFPFKIDGTAGHDFSQEGGRVFQISGGWWGGGGGGMRSRKSDGLG